jgi:hypothetical protein
VEAPSIGVTNSMSIHVIWPSQHHWQALKTTHLLISSS